MKAIQVATFGGPEQLKLVDLPTPQPGPGEVVIKVAAAGINFADLSSREGHYPMGPPVPFVPGMEVAGTVESVGDGVALTPGARVFAFAPATGGYAEYTLLPAAMVFPLPEGIDYATSTALLVQALTAYFMLETAPLHPGESVLVNAAAGGVGSLAVQIARLKGAGTVVGAASTEDKRRFITDDLGATAAVDYTQPSWAKAVKDATGGKGIDVFLDATGDAAGEGFDALAQGGRWLTYGAQSGKMADLPGSRIGQMIGGNQSLIGFSLYRNVGQPEEIARAMREIIGWVLGGQLKVIVDDRFPLADAAQAHQAIADRKTTGKVVLEP